MENIIFRGKRINRNMEWCYGDLRKYDGKTWIFPHDQDAAYDADMVDPATVGMFTGLLDKNGNGIYEGDIVSVAEYDNMLMHEFTEDESRFEIFDIEEVKDGLIRSYTTAISWEECAFVFSSNGEYNDTFLACLFGDMRRSCPIFEIEIVSNIHDNPDFKPHHRNTPNPDTVSDHQPNTVSDHQPDSVSASRPNSDIH